MGVPGFFGWLVQHCKAALVPARCPRTKKKNKKDKEAVEENSGAQTQEDQAAEELGRTQMDCLYLDLNGIVHPCCHPDTNIPEDEEEMMARVCAKIDELMDLVLPTRLLFIALDGTAPRAKINQQRTRRFRSAQLRDEEKEISEEVRKEWAQTGVTAPPEEEPWDSNVITPGTRFMAKLTEHLRYHIALRVDSHPAWSGISVIFSDANEPGEGEHKIIQFIKRQRLTPGYDANTTHCIVGEDADLIMLAMSIHSPHMYILRTARPPRIPKGAKPRGPPPPKYNYLIVEMISGYFEKVFTHITNDPELPKERKELTRLLDDLTLVFCLVGNDFLPSIPGMKIQHNAIGVALLDYVACYKDLPDYLTCSGKVNFDSLGVYLDKLKQSFRTVTTKDALATMQAEGAPGQPPPEPPPLHLVARMKEEDKKQAFHDWVKYNLGAKIDRDIEEQKARDPVAIGTPGWEERYYARNFSITGTSKVEKWKKTLAKEYLRGLAWVVSYYFNECPSWTWFYPYYYAPTLQDIDVKAAKKGFTFEPSAPYTPFEQLLAVLPNATAKNNMPKGFVKAITSPKSPIKQYYPEEFEVDLRSCPPPWHCTVILPFISDEVFLPVARKLQKKLTEEEARRNQRSNSLVFVNKSHAISKELGKAKKAEEVKEMSYSKANTTLAADIIPQTEGTVSPGTALESPYTKDKWLEHYPSLAKSRVQSAFLNLSKTPVTNKSKVLPGTVKPDFSDRLKPGPLCKKPSFSFQTSGIKAGLPLVLQPGKVLDNLQKHWAKERVPCWYFAQNGSCRYGDACHYTHVDPSKAPQGSLEPVVEAEVSVDAPAEVEDLPRPPPTFAPRKLYLAAGVKVTREAVSQFIAERAGVTPAQVKWFIPHGKDVGKVVLRFGSDEDGKAVLEALKGVSYPGAPGPVKVDVAPQRATRAASAPAPQTREAEDDAPAQVDDEPPRRTKTSVKRSAETPQSSKKVKKSAVKKEREEAQAEETKKSVTKSAVKRGRDETPAEETKKRAKSAGGGVKDTEKPAKKKKKVKKKKDA